LMIGSTVGGAVNANVTQLTLGNAAVVQGPISYISNQDAAVAPGASVLGAVQRTPPAIRPANPMGGWQCRHARAAARVHWSGAAGSPRCTSLSAFPCSGGGNVRG